MAGNYPDVPSWRMAWDRDGTQAFMVDSFGNPTSMLSNAQIRDLNGESGNTMLTSPKWAVFFPEKRDFDAYWINASGAVTNMEVSYDTTNGVDGTWTTVPTPASSNDAANPLGSAWRATIQSTTFLAVHGIRWTQAGALRNLHLFGEPAPSENMKRVEFWHPTINQRVESGFFDWGDVPRGSTAEKTFRLKNMHSTLTANDILLSMEALTDTTPSVPGQHVLSHDGQVWTATVQAGDLAPTAVSQVFRIRRITPSNAVLTTPRWAFRLLAVPTSWA